MDSLWFLDCPCFRCLFDDPVKMSSWRCNVVTCPELTEWLIITSDKEELGGKVPQCLNCGESKPLNGNSLCDECCQLLANGKVEKHVAV